MANQAVVMMVMVITLTIVAESEGITTIYWWSATGGCPGTDIRIITVGVCQCYKFPDKIAGYEIDMDGDVTDLSVTMYSDDSCRTAAFTFTTASGYCGQYGWESVMLGPCT